MDVWSTTSFSSGIIPWTISISGLKCCLSLTSLPRKEQVTFPLWFMDCWILSQQMQDDTRRHLRDILFFVNPIATHLLRESSCTNHLLFPPHLTQIHFIPSPFTPVYLSAFTPFNVSSLPILSGLSFISSPGVKLLSYLYGPVWPYFSPFPLSQPSVVI